MVAMEGSRGRRVSMVVVVAILVGLSSINVGGVRGQSSEPSSDKNCTAYLDPCSNETETTTATAEGCCKAVRTLGANVTCFCTIMREENVTKGYIQRIEQNCNVTIDTSICSSDSSNN
ncbi:hypothetical protein EJ110_NYTH44694 [Nymphaea thermarum]|nr:hypothetical protein EJ110_NYTH44694 [Nymphaea thermarum]